MEKFAPIERGIKLFRIESKCESCEYSTTTITGPLQLESVMTKIRDYVGYHERATGHVVKSVTTPEFVQPSYSGIKLDRL